ncbi:MAG: ABC-F family ATP-binding cassette domain-containing protein [Candidatus Aminicenantes bacterium]|nr:ABC-F family ATP-binding cassette domain-containing protein [Candidatus Aminicenantes bacterium]
MISLQNICLTYNKKKIFDHISWMITEKSRIGLVGDNGVGKTTLFRAIKGEIYTDSGTSEIPRNKRIGYLPQDLVELDPLPVQDYLKKTTGQAEAEKNIMDFEQKIAAMDHRHPDYVAMLNKFETAGTAFHIHDGYNFDARAKRILKGLGFANDDYLKNCREFSGGWKMRIFLAVILLSNPDIMLLDEPTNHLDTESMEWLENYLRNYNGTLLTISHDHMFLDKMVDQIAELGHGKITIYKGNYTYYLKEKEQKIAALQKQRELQKAEIKRLQAYINRFRAKASKASEVQSRIKQLAKFELVPEAESSKKIHFRFPQSQRSGKEVIMVRDLGKTYGSKQVFTKINFTVYRGEKIALLGINGAGKSTLVRILAQNEKPSQGSLQLGYQVKPAFFSQESQQNVTYGRTIWEEVNDLDSPSTDLEKRNVLGAFLFSGMDIHKPVSVLSGGEKSRLALIKILLQDSNFLILDEPTNHLDLKTKDIFQNALQHYSGTIILVSHDRYFLDQLVGRVFEIREGGLHEYIGNYSYFIQKREQELAAAEDQGIRTDANQSKAMIEPVGGKGIYKSKEQRRQEAEARNRRGKIKAELKKELPDLEKEIGALEQIKTRNQSLLCDPEVLKESGRIKPLMLELSSASSRLTELYRHWEELIRELENVDEMDL